MGTNKMPLFKDLSHPSAEEEKNIHKFSRLVPSPNSYFMDVKCPGCYKITTVFSHAQTVVLCVSCSTVLFSRPVAGPDSPKDAASERSPVKPCDVMGERKEAYLVNLVVVIMLETSHK